MNYPGRHNLIKWVVKNEDSFPDVIRRNNDQNNDKKGVREYVKMEEESEI